MENHGTFCHNAICYAKTFIPSQHLIILFFLKTLADVQLMKYAHSMFIVFLFNLGSSFVLAETAFAHSTAIFSSLL